uniref:Uncharacterized protein n=1 Tax=Plectus sambesii TaxID=2011161 RepID=A0A914VLY1_9BILA
MTPKQAWGCANSIDSVRSPLKTPQSAVSAGAVTRRPTLRELRAVCLIQAWWRGVQARTTLRPRLVELKAHRAEQYVSMLMSKVCKLDDNHQKSVQLNKELTEVMEQVVERVKRLEVAMAACLPTPIELGIEKKSDDVAVVRWNLSFPISQVKGYSLFVDGEMCGEVTAANQSAMITDLDFSQPHEYGSFLN